MPHHRLSLLEAILININIMMGSGVFINMLLLTKAAGVLSAAVYAIIGLLMFPVVLSMSSLLKIHPGGSFYTFGSKEINQFFGFLATWVYFIGKLASATLLIHFFSLIVYSLLPFLSSMPILFFDLFLIILFCFFNFFNLKVGSAIQYSFIFFKAIPLLFIILSGLFMISSSEAMVINYSMLYGVFDVVPLVVFAFAGFEAAASISRHIINPDKNAPKAVLVSFLVVVLMSVISTFFFSMVLASESLQNISYVNGLPLLIKKVIPSSFFAGKLIGIFQLAIGCSALGGAYGIIFSNNWNLYTLVENNHISFKGVLSKLNTYNIPFFCILLEAFICFSYLYLTQGNNFALQQIAAIGNISAFLISSLALLFCSIKRGIKRFWVSLFATLNSLLLLLVCLSRLSFDGNIIYFYFLTLISLGILMYVYNAFTDLRSF